MPASSPTLRRLCLLCAIGLGLVPVLSAAVECSKIEFRDIRSTVCRVNVRTEHLQLFLKDEAGKPFNTFERLAQSTSTRNEQLVFAMNAGMYREDYTPVGLMIKDGQQIHRLNLATGYGNFYLKPNGVFILTASGARILESTEYKSLQDAALLATQSGPLLVGRGTINASLNPQGTSQLIRNGVGVVSSEEVVFAISEDPITFYEFALLFRDRLKCPDALYLDGNVSSLYATSLGRNDAHVPLGPIIGVTVPLRH